MGSDKMKFRYFRLTSILMYFPKMTVVYGLFVFESLIKRNITHMTLSSRLTYSGLCNVLLHL